MGSICGLLGTRAVPFFMVRGGVHVILAAMREELAEGGRGSILARWCSNIQRFHLA